jgi:hypothetical protein
MIKALFFISNASQFLKTLSKDFRPIVSIAILQKIGIFFISAMIILPSTVKAESSEPWQIDPVFMNGFFMDEVLPFEFFSISGNQATIQNIEEIVFAETLYTLNVDSRTEYGGFLDESSASVSPGGKGMVETLINQGGHKSNNEEGDDTVKPSFWDIQFDNPFKHEPTDTLLWWLLLFFSAFIWPFISHKVWPFSLLRRRANVKRTGLEGRKP